MTLAIVARVALGLIAVYGAQAAIYGLAMWLLGGL